MLLIMPLNTSVWFCLRCKLAIDSFPDEVIPRLSLTRLFPDISQTVIQLHDIYGFSSHMVTQIIATRWNHNCCVKHWRSTWCLYGTVGISTNKWVTIGTNTKHSQNIIGKLLRNRTTHSQLTSTCLVWDSLHWLHQDIKTARTFPC